MKISEHMVRQPKQRQQTNRNVAAREWQNAQASRRRGFVSHISHFRHYEDAEFGINNLKITVALVMGRVCFCAHIIEVKKLLKTASVQLQKAFKSII